MHFMVVTRNLGMNRLPKSMEIRRSAIKATRLDGDPFELNLYHPDYNRLAKFSGAQCPQIFLDEQSQLYFWYRNVPHHGYYVQGWQKSRMSLTLSSRSRANDKKDIGSFRAGNQRATSQE